MHWVTSRRFVLPESPKEMGDEIWFNLWKKKYRPFHDLQPGDDLLWYESTTQHLRWRTKVTNVDSFQYSSKAEVAERLGLTHEDQTGPYFVDGPSYGYCLAYRVEPIENMSVPKPVGFRFPMLGWIELDDGTELPWGSTEPHGSTGKGIPPGITKAHVLEALEDLDKGVSHDFGPSTKYDLLHEGHAYPPKAVIGLAAAATLGKRLGPYDFTGGDHSKCNRVLRDLGFEIVKKDEPVVETGSEWSDEEITATVAAYFEMLAKEMNRQPFNKAEYNRKLREGPLHARSKGAVELKLANISSVLADADLPWIKGYKPRKNIQKALTPKVLAEAELRGFTIQPSDYEPTADADELARRVRKLKGHIKTKPAGVKKPKKVPTSGHEGYKRSPDVVDWVYGLAKGTCELCGRPAPFEDRYGDPYLECHHVQWLGKGGSDTVENAVAVCPNCHRLLHSGAERAEAKEKLYGQVERLERE